MIKSMALRPSYRSTKQILSYYIGGSWKCGNASYLKASRDFLHLKSFHATGGPATRGISSSRGRIISWVGTLSEKASNQTTNTNYSLRSFDSFSGRSQYSSFYRMLSTSSSSNPSISKKRYQNEDDADSSNDMSSNCKKGKDNSDTVQVTNTDENKPQNYSFQSMFRQYGKVFITTYMAVYVSTVLGLFMSVQSGQLDAMYIISLLTGTSSPAEPGGVADPDTIKEAASAMRDMVELLESYTLTRPVAPMVEEYPWTANFAIAWIATKFTEPIRFGVTVVVTPPIAKFFGYSSTPTVVPNGPKDALLKKNDRSSASNSANAENINDELPSTQSSSIR